MLSKAEQVKIESLTKAFWERQVETSDFRNIFGGKEIGHRVADYVDDQTVEMLSSHISLVHETNPAGKIRARSMGDFWVKSNDLMNPVNIKSGEYGKGGQPNLVSLARLLTSLLKREIDSYYLLIVKFQRVGAGLQPRVVFVDLLDYLSFVTFDSGPGQLMLKEDLFYSSLKGPSSSPRLSIRQKIEALNHLMRDGDDRLLKNREDRQAKINRLYTVYKCQSHHEVDQEDLYFG